MAKIAHLYGMGTERWQSFLIADVLQCIAVILAALQVLVLVTRTPQRYAIGAAVGCGAIVALTSAMWRVEWTEWVPFAAAAYLSPATGSLFPLFPWGAYILLGAVLGSVYVSWGQSYLARPMLGSGVAMAAAALICARVPLQPFGHTDFWSTSPNQFLLRSSLVLVALGLLAHISQWLSRPPFVTQALAHESLMIYSVHLCVVYGSVWNARRLQHMTRWFERCGHGVIFIARLTPGTRALVFLTAGARAVPLSTFLRYDVLGGALRVPAMLLVGHGFDTRIGDLDDAVGWLNRSAVWPIAIGAVLLVIWLSWGGEESKL